MGKVVVLSEYRKNKKVVDENGLKKAVEDHIKEGQWGNDSDSEYMRQAITLYSIALEDPEHASKHAFLKQKIDIYQARIKQS